MTKLFNAAESSRKIGKNIARFRQRAGLTQEEVAELLDVGNEAVSRMERGVIVPNALRLLELALILGCNASDFLDEMQAEEKKYSNQIDQVIQSLSEPDRLFVLDFLDKLTKRLQQK